MDTDLPRFRELPKADQTATIGETALGVALLFAGGAQVPAHGWLNLLTILYAATGIAWLIIAQFHRKTAARRVALERHLTERLELVDSLVSTLNEIHQRRSGRDE